VPNILGFHYTLKDKSGATIDSSVGGEPMLIMTDRGQVIPGLERVIKDLSVGDKQSVIVAPKDGYGEVNNDLRRVVSRSQFPEGTDLPVGGQFQSQMDGQVRIFTIMNVEGDKVYVDANHLLAGHELHFDIEITEKRDPSAEENEHGRALGPGGVPH